MRYLVCFLCGAMWTMFLTLEKHFVFKGKVLGATLCGFVIALLSVLLFKYYSRQDDFWEVIAYSSGAAFATFAVLTCIKNSRFK
jgi:hypothetical protein